MIAVVAAKNEKIMAGMGQCIAEMVAMSIFNEREGRPLPRVYGAVTTGHGWKFLKLEGDTVSIDDLPALFGGLDHVFSLIDRAG